MQVQLILCCMATLKLFFSANRNCTYRIPVCASSSCALPLTMPTLSCLLNIYTGTSLNLCMHPLPPHTKKSEDIFSQVHAMSLEMIILLVDEEAGDVKRCKPQLFCIVLICALHRLATRSLDQAVIQDSHNHNYA